MAASATSNDQFAIPTRMTFLPLPGFTDTDCLQPKQEKKSAGPLNA
jgi:hypothetical protein